MKSSRLQKSMRLLSGALLLGFAATSLPACADWPRWRGPQGTGHIAEGQKLPAKLPDEAKVLWKVPVGFSLGSPSVSGGKVFHMDNQNGKEMLHALDAASGRELWSVPIDDVTKDSQSAPGPRATPVLDGDRVYAQSCKGELQCLKTGDGTVVWKTNYVNDFGAIFTGERGSTLGAGRHGYTGSPLVEGDFLVVAVGGPEAGVVKFDKKTGAVIWKSQGEVAAYTGPVPTDIGGVHQYVAFMAESVMGIKADDGKMLWRFPIKTSYGRHAATPVVVEDTVVVSSHQVGLMGLKVEKKGDVFEVSQTWLSKDLAINYASPVAVGEWIYGVAPNKTLFCLNAKTGKEGWVKDLFFSGVMKRDYAGILADNDHLLALSDFGMLSMLAADPKQCRDVSRLQVCGDNWCFPAYDGGKLWLRDNENLFCVQIAP